MKLMLSLLLAMSGQRHVTRHHAENTADSSGLNDSSGGSGGQGCNDLRIIASVHIFREFFDMI